tara:strand:+ start:805 stop:1194 length:390 start_codon:yes stop_codon:yes gene_type:complete
MYDLVVLKRRSYYKVEFRRTGEEESVGSCPVSYKDGQVVPNLSKVRWDKRDLSSEDQRILSGFLADNSLGTIVKQAVTEDDFPKVVALSPRKFSSCTKAKPRKCGKIMEDGGINLFGYKGSRGSRRINF